MCHVLDRDRCKKLGFVSLDRILTNGLLMSDLSRATILAVGWTQLYSNRTLSAKIKVTMNDRKSSVMRNIITQRVQLACLQDHGLLKKKNEKGHDE